MSKIPRSHIGTGEGQHSKEARTTIHDHNDLHEQTIIFKHILKELIKITPAIRLFASILYRTLTKLLNKSADKMPEIHKHNHGKQHGK